jgi:hypothetical protein
MLPSAAAAPAAAVGSLVLINALECICKAMKLAL